MGDIFSLTYYKDKSIDLFFNEIYFIKSDDYHFMKFKEKVLSKFNDSINIIEPDYETNFDVDYSVFSHNGFVIDKGYCQTIPSGCFNKAVNWVREKWLKLLYFNFYVLYKNDFSILDNLKDDEIMFKVTPILYC